MKAEDVKIGMPFLERFAHLVAAKEREECVKQISAAMQDWFGKALRQKCMRANT